MVPLLTQSDCCRLGHFTLPPSRTSRINNKLRCTGGAWILEKLAYLLSIVHSLVLLFLDLLIICGLLEWRSTTRVPLNSFLGSAVPPTRCSPALDHQQCSTPHDQHRHMVSPLALAAASSTRTRLPLQPTTASIHGAPLRLHLHPQAKSHPSSPTLSVRTVVVP